MKRNKAFTLIELVSVLVILAILALIVTPLVLNIIRKARTAADKRSIDAYGRSIELAIADYLLEKGSFPTSIGELTIEYSGDRVSCSTTQLNADSSVYLAGCTVGNRAVEGYTYGKEETVTYDAYSVGDEVTYNNVEYYVIKDSGASESSVTLLKATPITSSEISSYLSSTEIASKVDTSGTYATMPYYSSDNCVSAGDISGCSTSYEVSDIKQVVDIWARNYTSSATAVRLITIDEVSVLGYEWKKTCDTCGMSWVKTENTPSWVYNENYWYWTMSQFGDYTSRVWGVGNSMSLFGSDVISGVDGFGNIIGSGGSVRPVITISKSALD